MKEDDDLEPRPEESPQPLDIPSNSEDRQMALFAHMGGILAGFVVPLIIWMMKKDQSRFIDDQGKEALNFQLNLVIHALILMGITIATCGFGALLYLPWAIYALVMPILAGLQANKGELYRYPATFRMIK
jgi:uncharacterized Tic20 family protein